MLVTIERVERRQGKQGSYHVVHLGEGKKLYCWDGRLAGELRAGATYDIEVREGEFPRLLRARPVATPNGALEAPSSGAQGPRRVRASRAQKLEALYLAKEALAPQGSVGELIQAAQALLEWLWEGEDEKGGEG